MTHGWSVYGRVARQLLDGFHILQLVDLFFDLFENDVVSRHSYGHP